MKIIIREYLQSYAKMSPYRGYLHMVTA